MMEISQTHDIIFIHVPKCAGTSVKSVLRQRGVKLLRLSAHVDDIRSGFYKSGAAARMRRHTEPDRWARSFKFAICRNPYDRLFSGWNFAREQVRLAVPFHYFVRHLKTYRAYWFDWHFVISQRQHVVIDGTCVADHICRFEHLNDDFDVVRQRLGQPDLHLPHLNRSLRGPYREHFTKELQDIAFDMFAADFEFFGYDYDL